MWHISPSKNCFENRVKSTFIISFLLPHSHFSSAFCLVLLKSFQSLYWLQVSTLKETIIHTFARTVTKLQFCASILSCLPYPFRMLIPILGTLWPWPQRMSHCPVLQGSIWTSSACMFFIITFNSQKTRRREKKPVNPRGHATNARSPIFMGLHRGARQPSARLRSHRHLLLFCLLSPRSYLSPPHSHLVCVSVMRMRTLAQDGLVPISPLKFCTK